MNILEVNNNVLIESKFKLKIIDGSNAAVYVDGLDNTDLMNNDYWINFLLTSAFIEVPIVKIDSMYKSNSIPFRNEALSDYAIVEVASDYNNNIIDFINKGVINATVPFSNMQQLIFILQVEYINDQGFLTTDNIMTGRPELKTNSTKKLVFQINSLDSLLENTNDQTNFSDVVLQSNNASFYNFTTLKEAYKRVINDPHKSDDDYAYPVCPFVVNEETYLPEDTNLALFDNNTYLPATYQVYAEDYVEGIDYRKQIFYYNADSPECGILDMWLDGAGKVIWQEPTSPNAFRMFTNEKNSNMYNSAVNIYENAYRLFRPVKSFIAPSDRLDMNVAWISDAAELVFSSATSDQYKISENDEIIIMEQLAELMIEAHEVSNETREEIKKIVMFQNTSNVYYYNKTKNIFYWNAVAVQTQNTPFPKQFLQLRDSGYFNCSLVFNSYYDIEHEFNKYDTFTRVPFMVKSFASDLTNWKTYQTYTWIWFQLDGLYLDYKDNQQHILGYTQMTDDDTIGFYRRDGDYTRVQLEPGDSGDAEINEQLDSLSKVNTKCTKMDSNIVLSVLFNGLFYDSNLNKDIPYDSSKQTRYYITIQQYSWTDRFADYEKRYDGSESGFVTGIGTVFDFCLRPYNENLIVNVVLLSVANYDASGTYDGTVRRIFPGIGTVQSVDMLTENYNIGNMYYSRENIDLLTYYFSENFVAVYDGVSSSLYASVSSTSAIILDINISLDRVIYLSPTGNIRYAVLSTDTVLFEDAFTSTNTYLLSADRDGNYYSDPLDTTSFKTMQKYKSAPVILLGFEGDRFNSVIGLANSFFKTVSNDNNGIKRIGNSTYDFIVLNDSMIAEMDIKTVNYNKIEYSKYTPSKTGFNGIDNELSDSKDQDDTDFDENITVNFYSTPDFNGTITLTRDATGIDATISNTFGTDTVRINSIVDYGSFSIDLSATIFEGTIICNFLDTEIEEGKTFSGEITRRKLNKSSVKDEINNTNNQSYIWTSSKTLDLKFPFLYNKYSTFFNEYLTSYFVDSDSNKIRKMMYGTITVNELLLFDENYNPLNLHDKIILVSSKKPLCGYYLSDNLPVKLSGNLAGFYIEKVAYNFNNRTTILSVVGV